MGTPAARSFRPRLERLEDRLAPAVGIFIENFASDLDPTQPGWDSWDAAPNTPPPGPDELHIRNDFPFPTATNGPTATGGYAAIQNNPSDPPPQGPFALLLRGDELTGMARVVFSFPNPGEPGGFAPDEEVAVASIDVRGLGAVEFVGASTSITFFATGATDAAGNFAWQHFSATRNSATDDHGPALLGGIRQIIVRTGILLEVNRLSVLVLEKEAPPPATVIANDDHAVVSQRQREPAVTFNWRQNDLQVNGEPLELVGHTQPAHGTVVMAAASGTAMYRPAAGFLGRDSFSYTVRDAAGNTDSADVILDVTNNLPPVADRYTGDNFLQVLRQTRGPFRWRVGYDDDGDVLSATLTQEPRHGRVEFRPVAPDANGRSALEVEYWPYNPHYGLDDGRIRFNDRFVFELSDGTTTGELPGIVEILVTDPHLHFITLPPFAAGDEFLFNADQPVNPALPGRLIIDAPGVLGNDDAKGLTADFGQNLPREQTFPFRPIYAELVAPPRHGRLALREDGSFEYLPDPDWVDGPDVDKVDSFVYRVHDGLLIGNEATAYIRVTTDALNEQFPARRRHWFTLVARTDVVSGNRFIAYITLSSLVRNDTWLGDAPLSAKSFPVSRNSLANGLHVEFLEASANGLLEFSAPFDPDGRPRLPGIEAQSEDLFRGVPGGVTFGRYRLVFRDGPEVRYSNFANFYVAVSHIDTDSDGIDNAIEADYPSDYPGIAVLAESEESQAALRNARDGRYVLLTAGSLSGFTFIPAPLQNVVARRTLTDEPPPAGVEFPIGFFEFGVRVTDGAPATVRIDPPPDVTLTTYWKFGPEPDDPATSEDDWKREPHWYEFTWDPLTRTGAVRDGNALVLHFRDGQRGDDDLTVNGFIWDPGAPAVRFPVVGNDTYRVREDAALVVAAPGVLANDNDPADLPLTAVLVRGPAHGRLALNSDGSFRYTPDPNFFGTDTFTYVASNGTAVSEETVVAITVTPVLDARIDVRPGNRRNPINLRSNGLLPVAILSLRRAAGEPEDFDAWAVDAATIRFGDPRNSARVAPVRTRLRDVDGDGDLDLVVYFAIRELRRTGALRPDSTRVQLVGRALVDGSVVPLTAQDAVWMEPPARPANKPGRPANKPPAAGRGPITGKAPQKLAAIAFFTRLAGGGKPQLLLPGFSTLPGRRNLRLLWLFVAEQQAPSAVRKNVGRRT